MKIIFVFYYYLILIKKTIVILILLYLIKPLNTYAFGKSAMKFRYRSSSVRKSMNNYVILGWSVYDFPSKYSKRLENYQNIAIFLGKLLMGLIFFFIIIVNIPYFWNK